MLHHALSFFTVDPVIAPYDSCLIPDYDDAFNLQTSRLCTAPFLAISPPFRAWFHRPAVYAAFRKG